MEFVIKVGKRNKEVCYDLEESIIKHVKEVVKFDIGQKSVTFDLVREPQKPKKAKEEKKWYEYEKFYIYMESRRPSSYKNEKITFYYNGKVKYDYYHSSHVYDFEDNDVLIKKWSKKLTVRQLSKSNELVEALNRFLEMYHVSDKEEIRS